MKLLSILILLLIWLYTFGFVITMWKEKQKIAALAVFGLCLLMVVLPFFTIYK